jgi:hypothetical protein
MLSYGRTEFVRHFHSFEHALSVTVKLADSAIHPVLKIERLLYMFITQLDAITTLVGRNIRVSKLEWYLVARAVSIAPHEMAGVEL